MEAPRHFSPVQRWQTHCHPVWRVLHRQSLRDTQRLTVR
ncbi:hypothetical protein BCEP27_11287 [Burkholderia cepacia]